MDLPPVPEHGDENRAASLLAAIWAPYILSAVVLVTRFYVRIRTRTLGLDDWSMLSALLLVTVAYIFDTLLVHEGGTRHTYYILTSDPSKLVAIVRYNWLSQPFGMWSGMFGKIAVALLLMRLLPPNAHWRRRILIGNTALCSVIVFVCSVLAFAQCHPARALWEKIPDAQCWDPKVSTDFQLLGGSYGAFTDFFLALFPVTIIWNLRLEQKQKVVICLLLSLGVIAGITAIFKTAYLEALSKRTDLTWESYNLFIWACLEFPFIIICGSVPTLRPLWECWINGKAMKPSKSATYGSSKKLWRSDISASQDASRYKEQSLINSSGGSTHIHHDSDVELCDVQHGKDAIHVERGFVVETRSAL